MNKQLKILEVPEKYAPIGFRTFRISFDGKLLSPVKIALWDQRYMKAHLWEQSAYVEGRCGIHALRMPSDIGRYALQDQFIPFNMGDVIALIRVPCDAEVVISNYGFRASEAVIDTIFLHPETYKSDEKRIRKLWEEQGVNIVVSNPNARYSTDGSGLLFIRKRYFGKVTRLCVLPTRKCVISSERGLWYNPEGIPDPGIQLSTLVPSGTPHHKTLVGYILAKVVHPGELITGWNRKYVYTTLTLRNKQVFRDNPIVAIRRKKGTDFYDCIEKIKGGEEDNYKNCVALEVKPISDARITFGTLVCEEIHINKILAPKRFIDLKERWEPVGVKVEEL